MKTNLEPILLIDENQGVYIPKVFCKCCNPQNSYWVWDYENFYEILLDVEHINYWDVWQEVLDNAYYIDPNDNIKYTLYQNNSLWAIPEGYIIPEDF
jgi:hypothetical protein